jgi:phytoene/squalene synthetase
MTAPEVFESRYRPHLDRVSRSFALCIRELQDPLRCWVGLSYLMCRLLDTVEDAPWAEPQAQQQAFIELEGFIEHAPTAAAVRRWAAAIPSQIDAGERALIDDGHALFTALHDLPPKVYGTLRRVALKMSCGMRHYAQAWRTEGSLTLVDLQDVNRYCYFVAGVVGELLTALFAIAEPSYAPSPSVWRDAQHFGLFLQKVNLLKDQRKDEAERRYLCPSRAALLHSLPAHAEGALRYLTGLPQDARAFRIFCAWSVFLGAASLPYIEADHADGAKRHKISRQHTQEILQHIAQMACDNQRLNEAMQQAMAFLPEGDDTPQSSGPQTLAARATHVGQERQAWFLGLDHAPLDRAALRELDMAAAPSPA